MYLRISMRESRDAATAPMQQTPLCGPKIAAFLKTRFCPSVFPIHRGGAADWQSVGRRLLPT